MRRITDRKRVKAIAFLVHAVVVGIVFGLAREYECQKTNKQNTAEKTHGIKI
jgi:hypothetical protein